MVYYEQLQAKRAQIYSQNRTFYSIITFLTLFLISAALVFAALVSTAQYRSRILHTVKFHSVPASWQRRTELYANATPTTKQQQFLVQNSAILQQQQHEEQQQRLVCYYSVPAANAAKYERLYLANVNAHLCTHINVGPAVVLNNSIWLTAELKQVLALQVPVLTTINSALKILLWVGGGDGNDTDGFTRMIKKHATRKIFIRSLRDILRNYTLHGVDLDWEFPTVYDKERQHLSQLLHEIKAEYKRERRDYLLSVAVAAVEGIAYFAYDVRELNLYADFVNLMSYDYHFYSKGTPFTGLNAPLYARSSEAGSILATLNINYSVNWWLARGLQREKLVVGLPTYGHSFTLVNPFNTKINAPARGTGRTGDKGFIAYAELCWFMQSNAYFAVNYDHQTCSPYLSSGTEWISFENEMSMACKAHYIKSLQLGGVMIFDLNTDDFAHYCKSAQHKSSTYLPLTAMVKKLLAMN